MKRWPWALPWLFVATVVAAQDADRMHSTECRQALDALRVREAAAASAPDQRALLPALQRRAAVVCLGGPGSKEAVPQRLAEPAVRVAPVTLPLTPRPTVKPLPTAVPRPAPPTTVTSCDATGCWASDGSRLQRAGPNGLIGPRGLCTQAGPILNCP
jgi:hypothetical protein